MKNITGKDISDLPDDSDDSIVLYLVNRFLNKNEDIVSQFFDKKGYPDVKNEFHFLLEKIDEGYEEIFYHLFLYSLWVDNINRRIFSVVEGSLSDDYDEDFFEESRGIKLTLARREGSSFKLGERRLIEFEDSKIFAIDKQTSDREKRDARKGIQRRQNIRTCFVRVRNEEDRDRVEFRVKSTEVLDILKEKISDVWNVSLVPEDVYEGDVDGEKFEEKILGRENDPWMLLSADFKKIDVDPAVPITLSKKTADRDIRKLLEQLDDNMLTPHILNIHSFWMKWEDIDFRVSVDDLDNDKIILDITSIETDIIEERQMIREEFSEDFGLPLDQEILEFDITGDEEKLIKHVLANPAPWELQSIGKEIIERIKELGVIRTNNYSGKGYNGIKSVEVSKKGVRDYIKDIADRAGLEFVDKVPEQIFQREYEFARFRDDEYIVDFDLPKHNDAYTHDTLEYLSDTLRPVLVVNIGAVNDELIEKHLSARVDLPELIRRDLNDENPEGYLMEKIEELKRGSEERISANAERNYKELKKALENPGDYGGTEVEQRLFPIIKQLIPASQQWGAKRKGYQPDGFAEIIFQNGETYTHRSIAYDSKFVSEDTIKFTSNEKLQARDYIERIRKFVENNLGDFVDEVEGKDGRFRNYIFVTNADEIENFDTVIAEKINKMRKWDGIAVIMHVEFLLAIYEVYNDIENQEYLKSYKNEFYEQLYRKINAGRINKVSGEDEDFFVELTAEDAKEVLENVEEEAGDDRLDITALREYLEEDIF